MDQVSGEFWATMAMTQEMQARIRRRPDTVQPDSRGEGGCT